MRVIETQEFGLVKVETDGGIFARIDYRGANPFGGFSWYAPTEPGFNCIVDDREQVLEEAYQQFLESQLPKHEPSHDEGSQP